MPRPINPGRKSRGFSTGERRWMLHTLHTLADKDGLVYERDLIPWWIPRLIFGRHVKRVEKGVLVIVKGNNK